MLLIKGQPRIAKPGFVPSYPSPLPMNIDDGLVVGIAPFTLDLVHDVFMRIEEPEKPLEFPVKAMGLAKPAESYATIGQFYQAIIDKLEAFGDGIFNGDPGQQVVDPRWFPETELFKVTNVATARHALEIVVQQGEGTTQTPLDEEGEYAHYYRFAEIWHGKRLVKDPTAKDGYAYAGAAIEFDASSVWQMPPNTKAASYPDGSLARQMADQFNFTYTKLLKALDTTFGGTPQALDTALGIMYEMRLLAQDVLATPDPRTGLPTGLGFEYTPLDR